MLTRRIDAGRPVDINGTLAPVRRGAGDPAHSLLDGVLWRACRTPDGPATLALRLSALGVIEASAWGPGADWVLEGLPGLLGLDDDWAGFDCSDHPLLNRARRNYPGLRLPRTGLILDALVPAILEQRVTGGEAHRAWAGLLRWHGEPAPGPAPPGLRLLPDASGLLAVPSWDWHRLGVDLQRQRAIRAAASVADRMEECVGLELPEAVARLRLIPGVGVWTAAETAQRALGHPDEVSVGDFHLHDRVVFALTGQARGDDARMLEVLAPWAGHRQRVVRLIEVSGVAKPKFGPRYAPQDLRAL
jgi:3-methyladenine DNA glycosylase/8-oxoguanine DNA glycosylase